MWFRWPQHPRRHPQSPRRMDGWWLSVVRRKASGRAAVPETRGGLNFFPTKTCCYFLTNLDIWIFFGGGKVGWQTLGPLYRILVELAASQLNCLNLCYLSRYLPKMGLIVTCSEPTSLCWGHHCSMSFAARMSQRGPLQPQSVSGSASNCRPGRCDSVALHACLAICGFPRSRLIQNCQEISSPTIQKILIRHYLESPPMAMCIHICLTWFRANVGLGGSTKPSLKLHQGALSPALLW